MWIKTTVRRAINKFVAPFGYELKKKEEVRYYSHIEKLPIVMDEQVTDFSQEDFEKRDKEGYTLSWIIPPLGPGSGGHIDIFRAVEALETMGIHNRVYICGGNEGIPSADLRQTVEDYYGIQIREDQIYASARLMMTYTDAVICTSWETAYQARRFNNCVSKFYFVQDFEPYFYPKGSEYLLTENTYHFGFRGVTAGDFLAKKLHDEYGMETQAFRFAYDRSLYQPKEKLDDTNRIFFYSRPYTERRAFEVGVMALEKLSKKVPDLEVWCAGQKLPDYEYPFNSKDLGILPLDQLCDTYSQCDMCFVLSTTNVSLLPAEIMASGSIVVSNGGENNDWLVNDENAVIVSTDPDEMAETMAYYLNHKEELIPRRKKALAYVNQFTWEDEMAKVSDFIKRSIDHDLAEMAENE